MWARAVVVGMDGSVAAFRALDAAACEAERRGAVLEVVHCVADPDEAGPVLRAAAARLAERHPGLAVRQSAVVGDPVEVLAERSGAAELVVVGSRGAGGLGRLLTHSVSRRLAARTRGPLLVVRGTTRPAAAGVRGGVLLGVAGDGDAEAALFAFEEAALCGCGPGLAVDARSVRAGQCRALIEASGTSRLVVLAAHRRRGLPGRELGAVTAGLLRHSRCPVVIVPVP